MASILKLAVASLCLLATLAFAADASERKFIRAGMSEGEVIMKIGPPNSESQDSGGGAKVSTKRWIYFPDSRDPQTITTLTIRNGQVVEVDRQISR
jgi:hypothetical protein